SSQVSRPFIRSFAEIVAETPTRHPNAGSRLRRRQARLLEGPKLIAGPSTLPSEPLQTPGPPKPKQKLTHNVPVREDHGLYAFFRRKPDDTLKGENRFEVVETPETYQVLTGRPWFASELRNKSFKDLHTLWYVCLREKNLLATQKEEVRRMGVTNSELQVSGEKVRNCRKTMARIKAVLNERRLAYVGAVELAEREHAAA
ncbi:MRP-L47-domain-containing protein, partial [Phlegmacium glaucopus]